MAGSKLLLLTPLLLSSALGFSFSSNDCRVHPSPCGNGPIRKNHISANLHRVQSLYPLSFSLINAIPRGGDEVSKSVATQSIPPSDDPSRSALSYYLIWTPGFAKKLALSTCSLLFFHFLAGPSLRQQMLSFTIQYLERPMASIFPNVVLPLLSSACCLIQIAINMLVGAGGCAGFNTYLGPWRPYFFSILAYLTMFSSKTPLLSMTTVLRFTIAFLPEFLHIWNRYVRNQWQRNALRRHDDVSALHATVEIDIPTMGCVACINKISSSIRHCSIGKQNTIQDASAWLESDRPTNKGGRAMVRISGSSEEELQLLTNSIIKSIEGAGFGGCTVQKFVVESN